jgi:diguanylate cyclase (GGDEF)-like protein/PAS domain S-box-containing protein
MITFEDADGRQKIVDIAKEKEINFAFQESQNIFRRLVERGRVGIFLADAKGYMFYVNHAFIHTLGLESKDDLLGINLAAVIFKNRNKREEFLKRLNETGSVSDFELKISRMGTTEVHLSVTSNLIEDNNGKVIGLEGIVHDVTENIRLEGALIKEKQKLEQLLKFDEMIGSIKEFDELVNCVVDQTAKILEVQKCSLMILNDQKQSLSIAGAQGLTDKIIKETEVKVGDMISGVVAKDGQPILVRNIEYDRQFQRTNRPTYASRSFMIVPVKFGDKVVGVINVSDKLPKSTSDQKNGADNEQVFDEVDLRILNAIAREVSVAFENVKLYKQLNTLEVADPLTHIYNYRQFSKSLDHEIKRCRRNNVPLCIMMVDVDNFNAYNEALGRHEGDVLLKNLGQIFQGQLREVDIICRYAGDEFAVILPDTDMDGARFAGRKIQEAVKRFTFPKEVTVSLGVAGYHGEMSQYRLILNADEALFQAKKEGKNRLCVFE